MSNRPSNAERILFLILLAAYLVPIWAFRYFPSADGPAHVSNAKIISEYSRPERAIFREYYTFNPVAEPNWSGHLIMAGMMRFVAPLTAEKLLISACILLLPISIRFALGAAGSPSVFLAILGFPFIYSSLLHEGLYNFCSSLPLFFFVFGYWFKHRGRFSAGDTAVFALLWLAVYFCHVISLLVAFVGLSILILIDVISDAAKDGFAAKPLVAAIRRHALLPLVAAGPTLVLVLLFLNHHGADARAATPLATRLFRFFTLHTLVTFDRREFVFSILTAALFGVTVLHVLKRKIENRWLDRGDGLLVVFFVFAIVYFCGPDAISSGSFIVPRLLLYPFFALILWLGMRSYSTSWRRAIQVYVTAIGLSSLVFYSARYAELNGYLSDYLSGIDLIRPYSTILPLSFDYHGHRPDGSALSLQSVPFWQPGAYISTARDVVDLRNYEAVVGHFPLVFRPERDPARYIGIRGGLIAYLPQVDFLRYSQKTGGNVDYVLLWLLDKPPARDPYAPLIFEQLAAGYDLIHVSPRGYARLYRRKNFARTRPGSAVSAAAR